MQLIKDPGVNFLFLNKTLNNPDRVIKIRVNLFLCKPYVIRSGWIPIHVIVILRIISVSQLIDRLVDGVCVCVGRVIIVPVRCVLLVRFEKELHGLCVTLDWFVHFLLEYPVVLLHEQLLQLGLD